MTLDVTIGKKTSKDYVKRCPLSRKDICEKKFTFCPRESYRSGSSDFWAFFKHNEPISTIYMKMRKNPNTNDMDIALLKPFLKNINLLEKEEFIEEINRDRLKWFKYWSNKAVQLYGKEAAIMFS